MVRQVDWETQSVFFAAHKDVNRCAVGKSFLIELIDDTFVEPAPEEVANHIGRWIPASEVASFINLPVHSLAWKCYQSGRSLVTDDGALIHSGAFTGMKSEEARTKMQEMLAQQSQ